MWLVVLTRASKYRYFKIFSIRKHVYQIIEGPILCVDQNNYSFINIECVVFLLNI